MERKKGRQCEAIEFAKSQRSTSNEMASNLWQWIRNRQIDGYKFRREFPIPPYTADFCCCELKLIIEVDGENHFTQAGISHDAARDKFLNKEGYAILRIPGYDILRDGRSVIDKVQQFVRLRAIEMNHSHK